MNKVSFLPLNVDVKPFVKYVSRFDIIGTPDIPKIISSLKVETVKMLAVRHLGDKTKKPHVHFYFESEVCKTTLRSRFEKVYKEELGLSGVEKQFQLPQICKNEKKYIMYLLGKQTMLVLHNEYGTPYEVEELARQSKLNLIDYKIKQSEERKEKKISYLQELINNYTKLEKPTMHLGTTNYPRDVVEHITTYVVANFSKKCDKFILKQHIYPIMFRVYPELFQKSIVENISSGICNEFGLV